MSASLRDQIERSDLIVTSGPGGVGKTSTAAALGVAAARAGRRVVVLTVDPARRLAEALGLEEGEGADLPHRVALDGQGAEAGWETRLPREQAPAGRILRPEEIAAFAVTWLSPEIGPVSGQVVELEQFPMIGRNPPKEH